MGSASEINKQGERDISFTNDVSTQELLLQAEELLTGQNDIYLAIEKLLRVLEINPYYASAHNDLGYAYWQIENYHEAKSHIYKAFELDKNESSILLNVFNILLKERKFDEAEDICLKYLTSFPNNIEVNQALSDFYKMKNERLIIPLKNTINSKYGYEKLESIESFLNFLEGREIPKFPLEMYLEISNVCDLKCIMCSVFSDINLNRGGVLNGLKMGFLDFHALGPIEFLLKHTLRVHCFGYGEPTIHPEFLEVLKYVTSFEVIVDFFTNGMHLTDELIQLVVDRGVQRITISFSGATKEEYENVYQRGNFEKVLDGIKRLSKYKKSQGKEYPIIDINSHAYKHHLSKFDQFVEIFGAAGVNQIWLKPLLECGKNVPALQGHSALITPEINDTIIARAKKTAQMYGIYLCISPDLFVKNEEMAKDKLLILSQLTKEEFENPKDFVPVNKFKEIAKTTKKSIIKELNWADTDKYDFPLTQINEINEILDVSEIEFSKGEEGNFHCMEPFKVMYIMNNGQTKPCCNLPSNVPALGNVNKHNGETIWRGNGFNAYRDAILSDKYPSNCKDCLKLKWGPQSHYIGYLFNDYSTWYYNTFYSKFLDGYKIDILR